MVYDIPSKAAVYRKLLELEEQVEKLNKEMEKVNKYNIDNKLTYKGQL